MKYLKVSVTLIIELPDQEQLEKAKKYYEGDASAVLDLLEWEESQHEATEITLTPEERAATKNITTQSNW